MKESIKMADYDGSHWTSEKIERTKILPLRWVSNWLSIVATDHLLKMINLEEDNDFGWKHKYHSAMWTYMYKPYEKWGTYYKVDMERVKAWFDQELGKEEND